MKKLTGLFIGLMMIIVLVACSNDNATDQARDNVNNDLTDETAKYEPEAIDPNTDVCEVCAMAVADDQHATQIILENNRSLKFDDLGCLYNWLDENGEDDVGAQFVRDFHTKEWVLMEDATFVFDEAIETPMAYGVISFKDEAEAKAYIDEHEVGKTLQANDLQDHKWQMMKHDHDDHDTHNHHE